MKEKELYKRVLQDHLTLPTELSAEEICSYKKKKSGGYVRTNVIKYAVAAAAAVAVVIGAGVWFAGRNGIENDKAEDIVPYTASRQSTEVSENDWSSETEDTYRNAYAAELYLNTFENVRDRSDLYLLEVIGRLDNEDSATFSGRTVVDIESPAPESQEGTLFDVGSWFAERTDVTYLGCRDPRNGGAGELDNSVYFRFFGIHSSEVSMIHIGDPDEEPISSAAYAVVKDKIYVCIFDQNPDLNSDTCLEYYYELSYNSDEGCPLYNNDEMSFKVDDWLFCADSADLSSVYPDVLSGFGGQECPDIIDHGGCPSVTIVPTLKNGYPEAKLTRIYFTDEEQPTDIQIEMDAYDENGALLMQVFGNRMNDPISFDDAIDKFDIKRIAGVSITVKFDTDIHSVDREEYEGSYAYKYVLYFGKVPY